MFLNDNYRILTIYPDIVKYINQKEDIKLWRDIEMKQARVLAHGGRINLNEYHYISATDKIYLETLVKTSQCSSQLEQAMYGTFYYETDYTSRFGELFKRHDS